MAYLTTPQGAGMVDKPISTAKNPPGVIITSNRRETNPTHPTIRTTDRPRNPTGIAMQAASAARRVELLKRIMHEIVEAE